MFKDMIRAPEEMEELLNNLVAGKLSFYGNFVDIANAPKTKRIVKHTITTTTYTLIEDDQLVADLVAFCNNRFVFNCLHISEVMVRKLLNTKLAIVDLYKYADKDDEYLYVVDYPDIYNYRWEGDYCPDAEPTVRRYSFSGVLDEFIELHPDKCRWKETVETKVIEED